MSSKKNNIEKSINLNEIKQPIFELKKNNNFIIDDFNLDIPLNLITKKLFLSCKNSENNTYLYKAVDDSVNQKWIIGKNTSWEDCVLLDKVEW